MAVFTGITPYYWIPRVSVAVDRRTLCFYRRNRSTTNASGNPNCTRTCGHTCHLLIYTVICYVVANTDDRRLIGGLTAL
jgi:hypothetical protein